MKAENTYHYFLVCPVLATPRATLILTKVSQVLSNIPNQYVFLSTLQSSSELHDLLLNGSNLLPLDINLQLFNIVELENILLIHNDLIHNCIVFSLVSSIILWGSHHRLAFQR